MKKGKKVLKLSELKVASFATSINEDKVVGGILPTGCVVDTKGECCLPDYKSRVNCY